MELDNSNKALEIIVRLRNELEDLNKKKDELENNIGLTKLDDQEKELKGLEKQQVRLRRQKGLRLIGRVVMISWLRLFEVSMISLAVYLTAVSGSSAFVFFLPFTITGVFVAMMIMGSLFFLGKWIARGWTGILKGNSGLSLDGNGLKDESADREGNTSSPIVDKSSSPVQVYEVVKEALPLGEFVKIRPTVPAVEDDEKEIERARLTNFVINNGLIRWLMGWWNKIEKWIHDLGIVITDIPEVAVEVEGDAIFTSAIKDTPKSETSSPVGAVVFTSSLPVQDANDPVWAAYLNKEAKEKEGQKTAEAVILRSDSDEESQVKILRFAQDDEIAAAMTHDTSRTTYNENTHNGLATIAENKGHIGEKELEISPKDSQAPPVAVIETAVPIVNNPSKTLRSTSSSPVLTQDQMNLNFDEKIAKTKEQLDALMKSGAKIVKKAPSQPEESIFVNIPLNRSESVQAVVSMTQNLIRTILHDKKNQKAAYMPVGQIHTTLATVVTQHPKLSVTPDVYPALKKIVEGMASFDYEIVGPRLMPDWNVVIEIRTNAPQVTQIKEGFEKINEHYALPGRRIQDINHISVAYIREATPKQLYTLFALFEDLREEWQQKTARATRVRVSFNRNKSAITSRGEIQFKKITSSPIEAQKLLNEIQARLREQDIQKALELIQTYPKEFKALVSIILDEFSAYSPHAQDMMLALLYSVSTEKSSLRDDAEKALQNLYSRALFDRLLKDYLDKEHLAKARAIIQFYIDNRYEEHKLRALNIAEELSNDRLLPILAVYGVGYPFYGDVDMLRYQFMTLLKLIHHKVAGRLPEIAQDEIIDYFMVDVDLLIVFEPYDPIEEIHYITGVMNSRMKENLIRESGYVLNRKFEELYQESKYEVADRAKDSVAQLVDEGLFHVDLLPFRKSIWNAIPLFIDSSDKRNIKWIRDIEFTAELLSRGVKRSAQLTNDQIDVPVLFRRNTILRLLDQPKSREELFEHVVDQMTHRLHVRIFPETYASVQKHWDTALTRALDEDLVEFDDEDRIKKTQRGEEALEQILAMRKQALEEGLHVADYQKIEDNIKRFSSPVKSTFNNTNRLQNAWSQAERISEDRDKNGLLVAFNDEPSHLPVELWKLVRTETFKSWFGEWENNPDRKSTRLNSSHIPLSRMPSSA